MKLYRVECHRDSDVTVTDWTTDLTIAKKKYKDLKDTWHDDEQAYEDDVISLIEIDVPEEIFDEFEEESDTLKEEVICVEPDDDEEGSVYSFWHVRVGENNDL